MKWNRAQKLIHTYRVNWYLTWISKGNTMEKKSFQKIVLKTTGQPHAKTKMAHRPHTPHKNSLKMDHRQNVKLLLLFSCSVVSDSLQPHEPCSMPGFPVVQYLLEFCSNSCPLRQWCHPTISSSVVPFSSCLQSFPASGSFPMSQLFLSEGQSTGASAPVHPMNIQSWLPLG